MSETVMMPVVGGLCDLEFAPHVSTGREENTRPGIGFTLSSKHPAYGPYRDGLYYHGMGVISRGDAARLRDMLTNFLAEFPPVAK